MAIKILISAGEVSGDQHLARVVQSIKLLRPDAELRGMAGRACAEAGAFLDVDCYRSGAGMGFFELFRSGGKIFSSFSTLSNLCKSWRPDLLILVDYPDFNLRLAKRAKRLGIKVLYYIPPKVWAWRSGRVRAIRQYVDHIAAIFPFEPEFYARNEYFDVTYVGHPLSDRCVERAASMERENSILLLPGSRKFEVERLLVPMLKACEILQRQYSGIRPVVVLAPNIEASWVQAIVGDRVSPDVMKVVEWTHEDALGVMSRARVGVLKSGTCNLEGAMAGLPFVVVYSGTLLAKIIVSVFVALKEYSPVNIIKPHTVKELIQTKLSPDDVAREVGLILADGEARTRMLHSLGLVSESLGASAREGVFKTSGESVSDRVAACALRMIPAIRDQDHEVCSAGSH